MIVSQSSLVSTGERFGKLTVVGKPFSLFRPQSRAKTKTVFVVCRCDCGDAGAFAVSSLREKKRPRRHCGCSVGSRDRITSREPLLYTVWLNMVHRCYMQSHKSYPDYGGRGITVCDEWRDNPAEFAAWSKANGWSVELQLDRRKNEFGYSPDNCRFVTRKTNQRNRRVNVLVAAYGEEKCIADWADDPRCQVPYAVLRRRLVRDGWYPETAIRLPLGK